MSPISIDREAAEAEQRDDQLDRRRAISRSRIGWLALIAGVIALAWYLLAGHEAPAAAPPPPTVTVAQPLQQQVTEWTELIGRFEPSRSVELRPRVSGQVTGVHFTDGQMVRAGQALFTIDPRPYRASLAEAQAGVATANSDLALARSDLARAQRLVEDDAVSKSEIDALNARVTAAQASLAAAQARVRSRALDVEFTTVRAPISGRISDRRVDPGNLVGGGDGPQATLLTTINAIDPLYFTFDGSEGQFLAARRDGFDKGTEVEIKLQDETEYSHTGTLDFTDNGLDAQSGTIRARALVRNTDAFLTPGMFGNARLAAGAPHMGLLVPDTAVQTDQTRKLLLVVDAKGEVAAKPVELGPLVGGLRVIRSGLAPSDKVIIDGTQMAMPGAKVNLKQGRIEAPATAQAGGGRANPPPGSATIGG